MDLSPILNPLNDAQRAAVTAPAGPGAGARRRRQRQDARADAPHRLADPGRGRLAARHPRGDLHQQGGRRDARPRRERCSASRAARCGSAPSTASRIGCCACTGARPTCAQGFQILDSEDQQRLIKKLIKALELDETRWVPREVQCFINKQQGRGPAAAAPEGRRRSHAQPADQAVRAVRGSLRARTASVDFAELLLRAFELWRDNAAAAGALPRALPPRAGRRVPGHQHDPVRVAASCSAGPPTRQLSVRGRATTISRSTAGAARASRTCSSSGATSRSAQLFRLEQNYRSTGTILEAANALIAHNTGRLGKKLWTDGARGDADPPLRRLQRARRGGVRHRTASASTWRSGGLRREVAILYRSNAQSRVFEEAFLLRAHAVPRVRRPALLRARRDQGCARLPAPDRQPRRRRLLRARREPADARHRRARASTCVREHAQAAPAVSLWDAAGALRSAAARSAPRPRPRCTASWR